MTKQQCRQIVPHKGGRSERFYGRCTPTIKKMEEAIKRERGESTADLFEAFILQLYRDTFPTPPIA